jgi:hypothetical protein
MKEAKGMDGSMGVALTELSVTLSYAQFAQEKV